MGMSITSPKLAYSAKTHPNPAPHSDSIFCCFFYQSRRSELLNRKKIDELKSEQFVQVIRATAMNGKLPLIFLFHLQ